MEINIYKILAINPGSTSTKISLFENEKEVFETVIRHESDILSQYTDSRGDVYAQKDLRKSLVMQALQDNKIEFESIDAVVGRAGRLPPLRSGTYTANNEMIRDIPYPLVHPALLGAIIAKELSDLWNVPSFFVDPTVVDEVVDVAKVVGIPEAPRDILFHALNQKAVARRWAKEKNTNYADINVVVAHMGGGISIGAHKKGLVVDITNPSNGEGPIAPERAGTISGTSLVNLCYSGKYTHDEMLSFFTKRGGFTALLGTSDFREVIHRVHKKDADAIAVFKALAYQVSKHIFSMLAILQANCDAVILTGGLAYSNELISEIKQYIQPIGNIVVYPGEDEMLAMAQGVIRVLNKEEELLEYISKETT